MKNSVQRRAASLSSDEGHLQKQDAIVPDDARDRDRFGCVIVVVAIGTAHRSRSSRPSTPSIELHHDLPRSRHAGGMRGFTEARLDHRGRRAIRMKLCRAYVSPTVRSNAQSSPVS